ncbi:GP1BA protein, partial [Polyodon spathula]|nr:GP1BA protein [Polyodon spathula]
MHPLPFLYVLLMSGAGRLHAEGSLCQSDHDEDSKPRINCSGAGLTSVPGTLHTHTEVLLLQSNSFTSVTWGSFIVFPLLSKLDLSHNQVSILERGSPAGLGDVDGKSWSLGHLHNLSLAHNLLSALPEGIFQALRNLKELYLQGNQLQRLPGGVFSELRDLEVLDLSHNGLRALPGTLIHELTKLKTFYLHDNSLVSIPDGFFSEAEIPYVYLSSNPWVCDCNLEYFREWIEQQSHNVYIRDRGEIQNYPESVLCVAPSPRHGQEVLDLSREDLCPTGTDIAIVVTDQEPAPATTPAKTTAPAIASTPAQPPTSTAVFIRHTTPRSPSPTSPPSPSTSPPPSPSPSPAPSSSPAPSPSPSPSPSDPEIWSPPGRHHKRSGSRATDEPDFLFCLGFFLLYLISSLLLLASLCFLLWVTCLYIRVYRLLTTRLRKPPNIRLVRYSLLVREGAPDLASGSLLEEGELQGIPPPVPADDVLGSVL